MNITVNSEQYFPDHLKNIKEFSEMNQAFDTILAKLWKVFETEYKNEFMSMMDADACERYEGMLGIKIKASDTVDDRQRRIIGYFASDLPYTKKKLDDAIKSMCGSGYYTLEINPAERYVTAGIAMESENMLDIVQEIIDRMVPANMVTTVKVMYNRYSMLTPYTHAALAEFTHAEIRGKSNLGG